MQSLNFLGRGSAFNVLEGNTSAFIKNSDIFFLIDCGSNVFEKILRNHMLDNIKEVYVAITHRHPDHVGSLGDLIFYCYYKLGIKVKLLLLDSGLMDYLLSCGVTSDKYEMFFGEVKGLEVEVEGVYAHHCGIYRNAYGDISDQYSDADNPQDLFPCFSLIINFKNAKKKIFFSGDCSFVDWWGSKINSCDEFYIDCCIADYDGNVHYNINKLNQDLYGEYGCDDVKQEKIYCMHFDCIEAIDKACELGFNVVETI